MCHFYLYILNESLLNATVIECKVNWQYYVSPSTKLSTAKSKSQKDVA